MPATGLRRGEAVNLLWSEVLSDRIVLMGERTKTAAGHDIPLTGLMRGILDRQPRTTSKLVFPSSVTGRGLTGFVKLKDRIIDDAAAGHFTLHDLRRTCRTLMSRLGVSEAVAELAIGHSPKGLISIYNLDSSWAARVTLSRGSRPTSSVCSEAFENKVFARGRNRSPPRSRAYSIVVLDGGTQCYTVRDFNDLGACLYSC